MKGVLVSSAVEEDFRGGVEGWGGLRSDNNPVGASKAVVEVLPGGSDRTVRQHRRKEISVV